MARGSRSRPAEKTAVALCMRHARSRRGRSAAADRFVVSLSSIYGFLSSKESPPHPLVPNFGRENSRRAELSRAVRRRRHPAHGKCVSIHGESDPAKTAHLDCTHEELFARSEPGEVQLQLRRRRLCASVFRQDRVGNASDVCQAVLIRLIECAVPPARRASVSASFVDGGLFATHVPSHRTKSRFIRTGSVQTVPSP